MKTPAVNISYHELPVAAIAAVDTATFIVVVANFVEDNDDAD